MSGPFVNNHEGECPKAEWFRGCKQPRDPGMPERAWGAYLPGDEPHWQCAVTGEPCREEECPLEAPTDLLCPECFAAGYVARLTYNEVTERYACPECDWQGIEHDRISTWDAMREEKEVEHV